MILGFKSHYPWGGETFFMERILMSAKFPPGTPHTFKYTLVKDKKFYRPEITIYPKIHSIRQGTRWAPFMDIHMAYGVRTKAYEQFNAGIEAISICRGVQRISIDWASDTLPLIYLDNKPDKLLSTTTIKELIRNDGFDNIQDFHRWFPKTFHGQLVHWTPFLY